MGAITQLKLSTTKSTIIVTDGTKESFNGVGCYFIRTNNKSITASTVTSDVVYGPLSPNIIPSLTNIIKNVLMPALKAQASVFYYNIIIL